MSSAASRPCSDSSQPTVLRCHTRQAFGLRQLIDAAEAVYLRQLADFDTHGDGAVLHGARSTSAWLQGALHLAPGEASTHVRVARASRDRLGESVDDLRQGRVTTAHLASIERSLRRLPDDVVPEAAATLGSLARQVDVGRLRTAGRRLQHVVDPDGALRDSEKQFERRYLQLSPLLDGMVAIDGLLDAEGAEAVGAALASALVPAGEHDLRSTAQRRADGLVDLARTVIDLPDAGTLSRQPVQVQVHVPWQTLIASRGEPALLGDSPREGTPLPRLTSERLGCDAHVARIVLGPDGVPLELGRSVRLFSPAQRRALGVRDGGCRFPGCSRPPRYTDAHHIIPWSRGGASDLGNALLLCRHHHRLVHERGWSIRGPNDELAPDGNGALRFLGPDGQTLISDARGP
jgi:Domain of unknown function (DUF222)/HNH endonuclease